MTFPILAGDGNRLLASMLTLTAMKGFTQWPAANEKLPNNPLASVRKPNPEPDRRRERWILLPEEWQMLRGSTIRAPTAYGMTSSERVLLYELAIQTGLRSNELRSLTRGQLFLDGECSWTASIPR